VLPAIVETSFDAFLFRKKSSLFEQRRRERLDRLGPFKRNTWMDDLVRTSGSTLKVLIRIATRRLSRLRGGFSHAPQPPVRQAAVQAEAPSSSTRANEAIAWAQPNGHSQPPEWGQLMIALYERMLRHQSSLAFREVCLDYDLRKTISFEQQEGFFLCAHFQDAEIALNDHVRSELDMIAAAHDAHVDAWPAGDVFMSFDEPVSALKAALGLYQLSGGARLKVGLARGARSIATVRAASESQHVSLGVSVDRAVAISRMAPAGSIRMESEVFDLVHDHVRGLARCVVATEYDSTGVEAVSLFMAPLPSEALSTFAGLGRL